ncbi:MAG: hypothetical protein HZB71_06770 [Betaproteobacteria bacterium]|nr:hypothetical protein [Betaproteobacteria bacterium]
MTPTGGGSGGFPEPGALLTLLGLQPVAEQFHSALVELRESEPDCGIGETAFRYWRAALGGS